MDKLNANTSQTDVTTLVKEFTAEQGLDCSLSLPEYFSDVVKVLRCTVNPVAISVTCNSGRITAEGIYMIRVIYAAENGEIYSYETGEQFSKFIDVSGCDEACNIIDFIWAEGVVCRAVNQRRMDVRATVRFRYKVYRKTPLILLAEARGDLQAKTVDFTAAYMENIVAKKITVNETYELPAGQKSMNRMIGVSSEAVVTESKTISNKIMVKGELNQKVLYIPDGEQTGPEQLKFSLPFSEIIEIPGINDGMQRTVELKVLHTEATMKPAQSGSIRNLECTVNMQAIVSCGKTEEKHAITDIFSTEYETQAKTVNVNSVVHAQHIAESFLTDGSFELADLAPENMQDSECRIESVKISFINEKLNVSGVMVFGFLLGTAAGTLSYVERNLDFNFSKDIAGVQGHADFAPSLSVYASSAELNGHRASVKAEIFLEGDLTISQSISVISEVTVLKDQPKQKDGGGMIIYFADRDESLWNIAKRYNTSPELLAKDNKISGDTVPEKQTLLISCI